MESKEFEATRENLEVLHNHEEELRNQSLSFIHSAARLSDHYTMFAISMDMTHVYTTKHINQTEDELTIQKLGLRLFNNGATAIKLALTGYYQAALNVVRDNIELVFILDYFLTNPNQVSVWSKSSAKERKANFSPVKIRDALDKRDGFKEKKRHEIYSIFSEYATHASFAGFRLLVPQETNLHTIGPFFDKKLLDTAISELVTHQFYGAVVFIEQFQNTSKELTTGKADFRLYANHWYEKYKLPSSYKD